jgi:hypothetical protein
MNKKTPGSTAALATNTAAAMAATSLTKSVATKTDEITGVAIVGNAEFDAGADGPGDGDGMDGSMERPVVERRRVNRGSTRRIVAAANRIDSDFKSFIDEMDLQFFEADAKGERLGTCEFVVGLRHMRSDIAQEVNKMLYPTGEPEAAE